VSAPYARLGRIVRVHGTQGEVTVALRDGSLSLSSLEDADVWIVPPPESGAVAHRLSDLRPTPKGVIARVSSVETAAEAHELTGRWLLIDGEGLPSADEAEDDVVGFEVLDALRGSIGSVTEIIVTGANDVLVVEGGPYGQVLVPVIDDVIQGVDDKRRVIEVDLLEGLIDEDRG